VVPIRPAHPLRRQARRRTARTARLDPDDSIHYLNSRRGQIKPDRRPTRPAPGPLQPRSQAQIPPDLHSSQPRAPRSSRRFTAAILRPSTTCPPARTPGSGAPRPTCWILPCRPTSERTAAWPGWTSARRSGANLTYDRSVFGAPGGGRPCHSASASCPTETTRPASSTSNASTARCFGPPSGTSRPPRTAWTGPKIRSSNPTTPVNPPQPETLFPAHHNRPPSRPR